MMTKLGLFKKVLSTATDSDIYTPHKDNENPELSQMMFSALKYNSSIVMEHCLKQWQMPNCRNVNKDSLLRVAWQEKKWDMVTLLFRYGAMR